MAYKEKASASKCNFAVLYLLFCFRGRWADLACDVMEERERAGETVGEMGPACLQVHPKKKTCTIRPLRMNCYKLWLEVPSPLGPIWSKPVYLTTRDHGEDHSSHVLVE